MKRTKRIRLASLAIAVTALVFASVASAHAPKTITIRHQMHGCHAWSFANGPYKATLKVRVDRDATLRFVNNDVMAHRLLELAGPNAAQDATRQFGSHLEAGVGEHPQHRGVVGHDLGDELLDCLEGGNTSSRRADRGAACAGARVALPAERSRS